MGKIIFGLILFLTMAIVGGAIHLGINSAEAESKESAALAALGRILEHENLNEGDLLYIRDLMGDVNNTEAQASARRALDAQEVLIDELFILQSLMQPPEEEPKGDSEPTVVTMEPTSAPTGAQVTINGSGFEPGEVVTVTFGAERVLTTAAGGSGAFTASFTVPDVDLGQYPVRAGSIYVGEFTVEPAESSSDPASGLMFNGILTDYGYTNGRWQQIEAGLLNGSELYVRSSGIGAERAAATCLEGMEHWQTQEAEGCVQSIDGYEELVIDTFATLDENTREAISTVWQVSVNDGGGWSTVAILEAPQDVISKDDYGTSHTNMVNQKMLR